MEKVSDPKRRATGIALGKFLILILFIIGAVSLSRLTPLKDFLAPQSLGRVLDETGLWAPVLFIIFEAVAITLFVPTSILIILAAGLFGAFWGFLCGWLGALAGASAAFFVGRALGRDFVASMLGDRLRKYDNAIEKSGFTAVLYLRLLNSPFTPMNYGLSLTKVGFRDYFFGTGLGVMVSIFVISFLSGILREVWVSGMWENLVSLEVFFAITLFIFSFFIPMILKRVKDRWQILNRTERSLSRK